MKRYNFLNAADINDFNWWHFYICKYIIYYLFTLTLKAV